MNVQVRRNRWDTAKRTHRITDWEPILPILMAFFKHGYLSTSMVHMLTGFGVPRTTTLERLQKLKLPPNRYIEQNTVELRNRFNRNNADLVYRLTHEGLEALIRYKLITLEDADLWHKLRVIERKPNYWHDVATGYITASIELGCWGQNTRFISLYEIIAKSPPATRNLANPLAIPFGKTHVVPDNIFGIKDGDATTYYALETDMGSEQVQFADLKKSSIAGKYRGYRNTWSREIQKSHFGIPNLKLIIATTKYQRVDTIKRVFADEAKADRLSNGIGPVYLRCVPALDPRHEMKLENNGTMLVDPWDRINNDPTTIFKRKTAEKSAA